MHGITQSSVFPAVLAALIVVIGWFVTNMMTASRETNARRAALRAAYIADAYEKLAMASNRNITTEHATMMELAVAKIQLYGTPEEIAGLNVFLDGWEKEQPDGKPRGDIDPILKALRDSLRREHKMAPLDGPVRWIRPLGGAK